MPDTVVRYSRGDGKINELPIRFLGPDANFHLKTEQIEQRLTEPIGPRLLDLLEIASSVFCADSTVSRGSLYQPREGRSWRRKFEFTFAVRDSAFWGQPDISRLLRDTIEFMTDDDVDCRFVGTKVSPNVQSYFRFRPDAEDAFRIDDVILFSGGIDSLAGALATLANTDRRIALVTHRSATKTMRHQDELLVRLGKLYRDRFLWIPVVVHRRRSRGTESTQRSRSLLFAALGCVVARMLGASRVQFFENGIVSQDLPLARPIVGTLATRTTHPQTLWNLQALLSQVSGGPFEVTNTFEWKTKTEVVRELADLGHADLVSHTVSCNHTFKRRSEVRHCGSCTQCLDRRFAVLANALGQHDPVKDYSTDVLLGDREKDQDRALAIEWVRHARYLARIEPQDFKARFMSELLRVTQSLPDRTAAMSLSYEMHRRHGESVAQVLNTLTDEDVAHAADGSIAFAFAGVTDVPSQGSEPRSHQEASEPASERLQQVVDLEIIEVVRHSQADVDVMGLQNFAGVKARLISHLLDIHLGDRKSGLPVAKFRSRKARELADALGVSEDYIRQEIHRIRTELGESWQGIHGTRPPNEILIKTCGKKGYRLDPTLNVIFPDQAE